MCIHVHTLYYVYEYDNICKELKRPGDNCKALFLSYSVLHV